MRVMEKSPPAMPGYVHRALRSMTASGMDPDGTVMLFSPHIKQITELGFANNHWVDIQRLSEICPVTLPLLHILDINAVQGLVIPDGSPNVATPSSHSLFSGAVDLKELWLHLEGSPLLNHFVFPSWNRRWRQWRGSVVHSYSIP